MQKPFLLPLLNLLKPWNMCAFWGAQGIGKEAPGRIGMYNRPKKDQETNKMIWLFLFWMLA